MARKGRSNHLALLSSPVAWNLPRKGRMWAQKPVPGPHGLEDSIPLTVLLRDVLKYVESAHEAKKVLQKGLLVDGRKITDLRFPIGLMDVLSIPSEGKSYRILIDSKGRLMPVEISEKDAKVKLCKVKKKVTIAGKKIQIGLHDGRTFLGDNHYKVGDSVKFDLHAKKVSEKLELKNGARCLVTQGRHAGKVAKLEEIIERAGSMDAQVRMKSKHAEFTTLKNYVFVIDDSIKEHESKEEGK
ncbi:30S ribosomal protein S4e [Candidatus Gugararchaeum adminiculabundum]|nr:30S ribosomal protein S4e [Candidatus Gugararchaeum adminiculabundum]